jgi:hypothetical protein
MHYARKLPDDNTFYRFARSWYHTFCCLPQDTGSGITLYAILQFAIGFQVSIDGGVQTPVQINGVCPSCNPTYNFTAYDIQSLDSGSHALNLTLLNATGVNADENFSIFKFDYAVVNETPTQTFSSTVPTSTPSAAAAHTLTTSTAAAQAPTASTAVAHAPTTSTAAPPSPAASTAQ